MTYTYLSQSPVKTLFFVIVSQNADKLIAGMNKVKLYITNLLP